MRHLAFLTVCALLSASSGRALAQAADDGYELLVPPSYDPAVPMPLVILLHGYGANGAIQEAYMHFAPLASEYGFLYLHPDGAVDPGGNRFWNATDACCDFYHSNIDHSSILQQLIDDTKASFNVDPRRVWIVGHSNGGFMSYRMACDHADTVAAIASLAGATFDDPTVCTPLEPVHVLQIHGTNDTTILYNGGSIFGVPYPGAVESVEHWATYDGCTLVQDNSAPPIDLDIGIAGDETTVTKYTDACLSGGSGELWTIVGGGHVPNLSPQFSRYVVEWFYAHPKPGFGVTYCHSDANSTGKAARMDAEGSASIAANDLALIARFLPKNQFGLFYYGPNELDLPFGNGTRCVGGGTIGVFRFPVRSTGDEGSLYQPVDNTHPPRPEGQIVAGSTWRFQAWFRDPAAGGELFDLSDGYAITFQP
jgi:polyhydroxybutyrate depolymerase